MKNYILNLRKFIIIQIFFYLVFTATTALGPYLQKLLFDNILEKGSLYLLFLIALYIVITIIGEISSYISEKYVWKTAIQFEKNVKRDFFKVICNMENKEFSKKETGEYISLQSNDITALEQDYLTPSIDIIKSFFMVIIYGIILFVFIDVKIAVLTFFQSLMVVLIPKLTAKTLSNNRKNYMEKLGKYVNLVKEFLENHKIITPHTQKALINYHNEELEEVSRLRYKYGKFKCFSLSMSGIATSAIHIVSFGVIGYLFLRNKITIGTAIAGIGYIECFIEPLESLLYDIDAINSTKEIRSKVETYVQANNFIKKQKIENFNEKISFEHVSVKYGDFILKDFTYEFKKGKKYVIIGPSGSGKSTILNVLMGYTDIENGKVKIDNKDTKLYDLSYIISYMSQNDMIFSTDFDKNVTVFHAFQNDRLKKVKYGREDIEHTQNCEKLSGGEKKIVSFLRMYLQNADICILDEPFSATDYRVTSTLSSILMEMKKTVLMVSHNISEENLRQFDKILIINKGELYAEGTYDEVYPMLKQ